MFSAKRFVSAVSAIVVAAIVAGLVCIPATATAELLINQYVPVNVTTTESSIFYGGGSGGVEDDYLSLHLVDGSGFGGTAPDFTDSDGDGFPEHNSTAPDAGWVGHNENHPGWCPDPAGNVCLPPDQHWVSFSLGESYELDFMRVWNYNEAIATAVGVQTAYVWYSNAATLPVIDTPGSTGGDNPDSVGLSWTKVSGPGADGIFTFSQATGLDTYGGESHSLSGEQARHILIDVESNHGDTAFTSGLVGLSEMQFFQVPEPSSLVLVAMGLLSLAGYYWRKRR